MTKFFYGFFYVFCEFLLLIAKRCCDLLISEMASQ